MPKEKVPTRLRRHEEKHRKQYDRDGVIVFLVRYLFEYFINLIKFRNHNKAYRSISYEVEARKAEKG